MCRLSSVGALEVVIKQIASKKILCTGVNQEIARIEYAGARHVVLTPCKASQSEVFEPTRELLEKMLCEHDGSVVPIKVNDVQLNIAVVIK